MTIISNGHLWKHTEFIENKNFSFNREKIFLSLSKKEIDEAYSSISSWEGYAPTPLLELYKLAKELNIPVIALSQLSRAVETRGGTKRPMLSDLRESGAIEQDADIVSFIYRPEYYGIDEWDDEERTPSQGQAEFIVAKHRNGGLDNIRLKFVGHLGKFEDLDSFDTPFEFQSKMNTNPTNEIPPGSLPSASDAFGDSDDDIPF